MLLVAAKCILFWPLQAAIINSNHRKATESEQQSESERESALERETNSHVKGCEWQNRPFVYGLCIFSGLEQTLDFNINKNYILSQSKYEKIRKLFLNKNKIFHNEGFCYF